MSKEKRISLYQEQKVIKPLIEDLIPCFFDGDTEKSVFDLVAFMRANKLKPSWCLTNAWKAVCKGKNICYIRFGAGSTYVKDVKLVISLNTLHIKAYEQTIIDEGLQQILWGNVLHCIKKAEESCNNWGCAPGKTVTICGKDITNICCNSNRQHFWFHDPDVATIEAIKRLLELEKKARYVCVDKQ